MSKKFLVPKVLLSPLGLWFGQRVGLLSYVTSFAKLATFSLVLLHLMLTAVNLAANKHPLPTVTFLTLIVVRQITTISKIIALDASRKSLRKTIDECFSIKSVPFQLRGLFEELKEKCNRTPRSLLVSVLCMLVMHSPLWFTSYKKEYPLAIWLPVHEHRFPRLCHFVRQITNGTFFLMVMVNAGSVSLLVSIASACKNMIQHLNQVLETLGHPELYHGGDLEPELLRKNNSYNSKVHKTLVYVHKFHLKIFSLVASSNRTFSIILMLEVWAMIAGHCVLTYSLTRNDLSLESKIAYIINMINTTLLFSAACYEAGEASDESIQIKNRCFGTAWWTFNSDNVFFIKIIGLRSTEPIRFKAGFLNAASLRTIKLIAEISFTYFLFLYRYQN